MPVSATYRLYLLKKLYFSRCSDLSLWENPNSETLPECIQLALWAPKNYGLAFVANNNIYYVVDARNSSATVRQVTHDGSEESEIYNGVSNWINGYFSDNPDFGIVSLWFSHNATYLLYFKHDESQVEEIQWPIYGYGTEQTKFRKVKCPKVNKIFGVEYYSIDRNKVDLF